MGIPVLHLPQPSVKARDSRPAVFTLEERTRTVRAFNVLTEH